MKGITQLGKSERVAGTERYFLAEDTNKTVFMWNEKEQVVMPVIVATRGIKGAPGQSIAHLWNAFWTMDREPVLCQYGGHGYAFVRTNNFKNFQKDIGGLPVTRGLLLDDDILITNPDVVMDAIRIADKYGWNFVSPYRVTDGHSVIADRDGALLTVEECKALDPWQKIERAGLGFYYGDIPLNYVFHENSPHGGEDLNFFYDNPQLEVRICDVQLMHLKEYAFGMDTVMAFQARPRPKPQFPADGKPIGASQVVRDREANGAHD